MVALTHPRGPAMPVRFAALPCIIASALLIAASPGCNIPSIDDYQNQEGEPSEPPPPPIDLEPPPLALGFEIVELEPATGRPNGLELVEILGGGFREGARVFFGGSEASDVTVTSEGRIFALTPPHSPGRVTVRIINPNLAEAAFEPGYLYFTDVTVTDVQPPEGPATGGIPIEVHGTGFVGVEAVLFDGRQALDVTVLDDRTLLAILPSHEVGAADIHVVTEVGTGRQIDAFQFYAAPEVTGFSPLAGPASGGGTLALAGAGLVAGSEVAVGGTPAELLATAKDGSKLVVRLPPGEPGLADLSITTEHGQVELREAFTYLAADANANVTLHNVWPATGPATGGGEVNLVISGLHADSHVSIAIGGVATPVSAVLPGQSLALTTAPAGTPGTVVDVSVEVDGIESTLTGAYGYVAAFHVAGISPMEGPAGGGTEVTITGVGFERDDLELFIGALPASSVEIVDDTRIIAHTPAGSPGFADVRIRSGSQVARLTDGFAFRAGETRVWLITPDHGAIAGNTWVTLYGTDLPPYMDVRFDGVAAPYVERTSPTTIVARSPRVEDIGTVDVRVAAGPTLDVTLPQAYTFYDPTARWGGTWGERIDGSVNVTVLTSGDDEPIEGAVVVLGHQDPPQYKGYTDDRGQVTLSGPGLGGRLDVTAALFGASASSVIGFDAENVTLFLNVPASGGGGGGTMLQPGTVTGEVHGMGKYVVLPPWPCDELTDAPDGYCDGCQTDADCAAAKGSAAQCTTLSAQRPFCSSGCEVDEECPVDFVCTKASTEGKRCVPSPGRAQARCFVTSPSILSALPTADELNTIEIAEGEIKFQLDNVRLGEVSVYCFGGAFRTVSGEANFKPYVMGILRHQFVAPGADPTTGDLNPPLDVAITLDIPLSRSVGMVIGEQPLRSDGPHRTFVDAFLDLGSDGFVPLAKREIAADADDLRFSGLPQHLVGELYDAEYVFHAAALSDTPDTLPSSEVLRAKLGTLDDGSYLVWDGASWVTTLSGYSGDVLDVWADSDSNVFAATREGTVIHYNGQSWYPQPIPQGPPLRAIASDLDGGAIVVGDAGRILRWNGVGWSTDESPTSRDLRGVAALGAAHAVAVGSYTILEWDGLEWTEAAFGPPKDLQAVWANGVGDAWASGAAGVLLKRSQSSSSWVAVDVPVYETLHGLWGSSDGLIIGVGGRGTILLGSEESAFVAANSPTNRTLRDVWGRSAKDVYAVGDAATVIHYDGVGWSVVSQGSIESSLRTIDGAGPSGETIFAMGTHAVHLDRFLTVPTFTSPAPKGLWNKQSISWDAPGGGDASFHSFRIYGPNGALAWSIMAPGQPFWFGLPDLAKIEGLPIVPNGQKRLILYRIDHPDFDIDDYDSRIFRLMDWRAWALLTYLFDDPSQVVDTGTVPGS